MTEEETKKSSPKTTIGGILGLLAALTAALYAQFDGIEATEPNWALVGTAAAIAFALWQARDHSVSSKAAGVDGD